MKSRQRCRRHRPSDAKGRTVRLRTADLAVIIATLCATAVGCSSGSDSAPTATPPSTTAESPAAPSFHVDALYTRGAKIPRNVAQSFRRGTSILPGNRLMFTTRSSTGCEQEPAALVAAVPTKVTFEMKNFQGGCLDDQHDDIVIVRISGVTLDQHRVAIVLRYPFGTLRGELHS